MSVINWKNIHHFESNEFPEDPELAEPKLIYRLDDLRESYGRPIYPSTVKGALARFGGAKTSQHYVGEDEDNVIQNSQGIDVFPEGIPISFYSLCLSGKCINGVGVYLDTTGLDGKPWIMFHIDIRNFGYKKGVPLIWICIKQHGKNVYLYPQIKSIYWDLLQDERLFIDRIRED